MRHVRNAVHSGVIGISIGMSWLALEILLANHPNTVTISGRTFLYWLSVSFLIGVFFYLAGLIFSNDGWSLRKQIVVNFFVCFSAYGLYALAANDFSWSWQLLLEAGINFVIMYTIAYGLYFLSLWREVRQINEKIKKREK